MKKTILLLGMLSAGYAYTQSTPNYGHQGRVGINTTTPLATMHIEKRQVANDDKRPQGVIFPHITTAERNAFTGTVEKGTMIYNTTENCIDLYDGTQWSCITTKATAGNTGGGGNPSTGGGGYVPGQGAVPATVTLKSNSHFIASIYDNNYLPYTAPNAAATVGVSNPDNQTDTVIDVPGVIPAGGIAVQIPITATGSGTLMGSTLEATIQAVHTKGTGNTDAGNTPRKVLLTWPNTAFTNSDTSITAFIKPADGQEIQIRRLDLNNGIGNDGKGIEIAKFSFAANTNGSQQATFKLHAIAGVPDKKFGQQMNNKLEHQFIYIPIMGPDGKLWLNNNLGAEYANITSPYFNPVRQAGALDYNNTSSAVELTNPTTDQIKKDWRAYGYLYEWKRDSDGHEVIKWTNSTSGIFANPSLHNYNYSSPNNPAPDRMGDPCPSGFHTPTEPELRALHGAILGTTPPRGTNNSNSNKLWQETGLKLPAAGYRNYNSDTHDYQSGHAWYWSSTEFSSTSAWVLYFYSRNSYLGTNTRRTLGFPVRCIAD